MQRSRSSWAWLLRQMTYRRRSQISARHSPELVTPGDFQRGEVSSGSSTSGGHWRLDAPPSTARKGGAGQGACPDPHDEPPGVEVAPDRCGDGECSKSCKYPHCPVKEQVLPEGSPAHPRPLVHTQQQPPPCSPAHPARSLPCLTCGSTRPDHRPCAEGGRPHVVFRLNGVVLICC